MPRPVVASASCSPSGTSSCALDYHYLYHGVPASASPSRELALNGFTLQQGAQLPPTSNCSNSTSCRMTKQRLYLSLLDQIRLLQLLCTGVVAFECCAFLTVVLAVLLESVLATRILNGMFLVAATATWALRSASTGVDFLAWSGPALLIFICDPECSYGSQTPLPKAMEESWEAAPVCFAVSLLYALASTAVSLTTGYGISADACSATSEDDHNLLDLFDGNFRKHFWLADFPGPGSLTRAVQTRLTPADLEHVPYRCLLVAHNGFCDLESVVSDNDHMTTRTEIFSPDHRWDGAAETSSSSCSSCAAWLSRICNGAQRSDLNPATLLQRIRANSWTSVDEGGLESVAAKLREIERENKNTRRGEKPPPANNYVEVDEHLFLAQGATPVTPSGPTTPLLGLAAQEASKERDASSPSGSAASLRPRGGARWSAMFDRSGMYERSYLPLKVATNVELNPAVELMIGRINLLGCLGKNKFREPGSIRQLLKVTAQLQQELQQSSRIRRWEDMEVEVDEDELIVTNGVFGAGSV
eukprot:g13723.t1